jgi:hypothetical protein
MLFELRQYVVRPGHREEWVRFFEDEIVPFQTSKGMRIIGSWVGESDPEVFVWIRGFKDEADRIQLYQDVYESDEWKTRFAPRTGAMLDREKAKITRLEATPASAVQ